MKPTTISQGATSNCDLIPNLLRAVRRYCPTEYEQLMVMPFGPIPAYVYDEGATSKWWETEDANWLAEELYQCLEDAAPDGFYSGPREDDTTNLGFWPTL
jgi:hypothetical protein